jgi:hypothetical protein
MRVRKRMAVRHYAGTLMGAPLRWGQPGDVCIDAHLKHGKQPWCYLVDVNVPELLKRAEVLFNARPEVPDGLQDRQRVSKQLDVRLIVRIHYLLDEFMAEIVVVGVVDVVQPVGLGQRDGIALDPRIVGVIHRFAQAELDLPGGQFLGDGPGIRQGPGQPVQLGHHQGVAVDENGSPDGRSWRGVDRLKIPG